MDQQIVCAIRQVDAPGRLAAGDNLLDQSFETPTVGDRSVEIPDDLAAPVVGEEVCQQLDGRLRGTESSIVSAHSREVPHDTVSGQQDDSAGERCFECQQNVIAVDDDRPVDEVRRGETLCAAFEASAIASCAPLESFPLAVPQRVAISDHLQR